jgi:DNA-binding transcriptional ArsR family regulator
MEEANEFISISALIGEPARAIMLWNLLDGRAYTASELGITAGISSTSASNHLSKLLKADLLKVEAQGRHRYFSFARPEVAYVVESLASLTNNGKMVKNNKAIMPQIKYCRSCYDHLAGYVGVKITEAMEKKGSIIKAGNTYNITQRGWKLLQQFDIIEKDIPASRRALTRQCLDWSERRPHLAGQLGALLLDQMLKKKWFKKVQFSRELIVTTNGKTALYKLLGVEV